MKERPRKAGNLRIAVHDYAGHPFQVQLSRELARRGHEVAHFYCSSTLTPHGDLTVKDVDPPSLRIVPVALSAALKKYSPLQRLSQDLEYGKLIASAVQEFRPDVLMSANTPLPSQWLLQRYCRAHSVRFVFWLQDLYAAAARRVLSKKLPVIGVVGAYALDLLEQWLLKRSDAIIVITGDFVDAIAKDARARTAVIPNWAPLNEVPMRDKDNAWSRKNGLHDSFCFLYTGTLGFKHNPRLLLDLAQRTAQDEKVRVVVVSEGIGADWLKGQAEREGIRNLLVLGFQPFEAMPDTLATGDVLIGVLERDAGRFSVPSKVLTYLCAGRPLLLSVPLENLAAQTVVRSGSGLVSAPDDTDGFYRSAAQLRGDASLRQRLGQAGRQYAQEHFDIRAIADRFLTHLHA